jgi:type IV pilus assembly protein PilW
MRVQPGSADASSLRLTNTLGVRARDLVLVAEDGVGCLLEEVAPSFVGSSDQLLSFGGTYYTPTGTDANLPTFTVGGTAYAIPLGSTSGNPPQFQMFGVGANNTLFSYDILRMDGGDPQAVPIAEGVVELRALYGVDTNGDGTFDNWVDPADNAAYAATALLDGSAAARDTLRTIVAVRVGLILRTPLMEREDVAPATVTLFPDLATSLQQARTLSADERRYRHRTVETTIPLRNILLLPAT